MRLSTVLAVLLGLVALVVGGIAVFLATLDVGRYKPEIIALIEGQTGRSVAIDGDLDLSVGLTPALVVEDVHLGNADWAQDPDMVSVGRLEAQVALLPLLSGDLRVVRLVLSDAAVWLESDADGRGNWTLGPTTDAEGPDADTADVPDTPVAQSQDTPTAASGGAPGRLDLQDVRLENATVILRDGVRDQTFTLELDQAVLKGDGVDAPLGVDLAGRYNGLAFSAEGTLGSLMALGTADPAAGDRTPWPLDVTASAAGATLTVTGAIADPIEGRGFDLTVTARGSQIADLAALGKVVGQTLALPDVGAYDVTLDLSGDADALSVSTLDASLGTLPLLKATASGHIDDVIGAKGIALTVTAEGGEVADLMRLPTLASVVQTNADDLPMLGPFRVSATADGDAEALAVRDLSVGVGPPDGLRLTATGAVTNARALSGIDLDVTLNAPDPNRLAALGLPVSVPVRAGARVSDITGGYRITNLTTTLGRSQLDGTLEARLDGPRPRLSGQLTAPVLDLMDLTGASGAQDGNSKPSASNNTPSVPMAGSPVRPAAPNGTTLIPDTPLPLDALSIVDANLSVQAGTLVLPNGLPLTDVSLTLALANGALTVDPLRAGVADGRINATVGLTPTGGDGAANLRLDLAADDISLGTLAEGLGQSGLIQNGPTKIRASLTGRGGTPHQIAGTLNGHVLVHTVNAILDNGAVDWAGGDVSSKLIETINPFSKEEPSTPVRCLVFNMTAANGILSNDHGLALETDRMVVGGGGGFDLGTERLNLKIAPAAREGIGLERGLGRIVELFAVTGPFSSPKLVLDAREAVRTGLRTAASAAGAVATGGLSLLGEDLASRLLGGEGAEMEPCLVALGEKQPGQGSTAESGTDSDTTSDSVDAVRKQAEEAVEGLTDQLPEGLGEGLRQLFK